MGVCLVTSLAPAAGPPRRATAPEHGGTSRPLPAPGCRQPKKTMNFSLAGVPEKQGGLGSTLAAPQAVKAGLTQPESPQESHPEQREPESSHQGPRRACPPQQCPAPCFPPPHTSLSFLLLPVGCPKASRCRIITAFSSAEATQEKLQHLPFLPPHPSAESTPPFNFHQLFTEWRAAVWSLNCLFRPWGCQPRPLQPFGAAGAMASDNESTFVQGDGH